MKHRAATEQRAGEAVPLVETGAGSYGSHWAGEAMIFDQNPNSVFKHG